jgi:hypothetical protein
MVLPGDMKSHCVSSNENQLNSSIEPYQISAIRIRFTVSSSTLCAMRNVAENKTVIINRIAWVNFGL